MIVMWLVDVIQKLCSGVVAHYIHTLTNEETKGSEWYFHAYFPYPFFFIFRCSTTCCNVHDICHWNLFELWDSASDGCTSINVSNITHILSLSPIHSTYFIISMCLHYTLHWLCIFFSIFFLGWKTKVASQPPQKRSPIVLRCRMVPFHHFSRGALLMSSFTDAPKAAPGKSPPTVRHYCGLVVTRI